MSKSRTGHTGIGNTVLSTNTPSGRGEQTPEQLKGCRATPKVPPHIHTTPLFVRKEPPAARTRCPSCSIVLTAPRGKHLSSTTQRLVCRIQSSAPQHLIAVWRPPLPSPSALPEACAVSSF